MPREPEDAVYLWDILDAARAVVGFLTGRSYNEYVENRMLRNAVERNVEIIGAAAGRVSPAFRSAHPEIPWRRIVGLRNILAHEYGEIKHDKMWVLVQGSIPELIRMLEGLAPSAASDKTGK